MALDSSSRAPIAKDYHSRRHGGVFSTVFLPRVLWRACGNFTGDLCRCYGGCSTVVMFWLNLRGELPGLEYSAMPIVRIPDVR